MKKRRERKVKQIDMIASQKKKESQTVNRYQRSLERKLETVSFVDELRKLTRQLKKRPRGYIRDRKKWLMFEYAERRVRFLRKELETRGFSGERLAEIIRQRKTEKERFYAEVSKKVAEFAKKSPEKARAVEATRQEVRSWSFVDPKNPEDVDFHTLIELRRKRIMNEKVF